MDQLRIGIIGLGTNCRERHVPGLLACEGVEIAAVCNRRPDSTDRAAAELGIPKKFDQWQQLVADPEIDAVVIGTWPYLHCPITLAALEAGKHVMTEARMAMNAAEAHAMHKASQEHPQLITQVVPSPFGLKVGAVVRDLIAGGYLGELREAVVLGTNNAAADPQTPLHWRQSAEYSGSNMLMLGILHETLVRWVEDPLRVRAQTSIFTTHRPDPTTGATVEVGTPDSVHLLAELPGSARAVYHLSGAIHHGPTLQIHLYGSSGTLKIEFHSVLPDEKLFGGKAGAKRLDEIPIPAEKAGRWRVEEEFVAAIRGTEKITLTDFTTGVRYMEFTEAVAQSAETGVAVELPLGTV